MTMRSDLEFTIDELEFLDGVLLVDLVKTKDKDPKYFYTLRKLRNKVDRQINYLQTTAETPIAEKNTELEDIKRTVNELTEAVRRLEQRNDELGGVVKRFTQVVNGVTLYNRRYK